MSPWVGRRAMAWALGVPLSPVLLLLAVLLVKNAQVGRRIDRLTAIGALVSSEEGFGIAGDHFMARLPHWLQSLFVLRRSYDVSLGTMPQTCVRGETLEKYPSVATGSAGDADLALVRDLGLLGSLTLTDTGVTDAGLAHLRGLPVLERLVLDGTFVRGTGFAHLRGLPLRVLSLRDTFVDDASLAQLPNLPALERLSLDGTPVRGPGLAQLARFPALRELDLGLTPIDDDALRHLEGLPLTELSLWGTAVSDAALAHLERLPRLEHLYLCHTRVTVGSMRRLRASRVWTVVGDEHECAPLPTTPPRWQAATAAAPPP